MQTDAPGDLSAISDQLDDILGSIPQELFAYHELPVTGEKWSCPYEGCTYQTPSKPCSYGTDSYDIETLRLRQTVSRHLWDEHLPENLLEKLIPYLAEVE